MKSPVKVRTFSLAVDRNGDVAHIRKGSTPARNGDYVTSGFYGNATAFNSAMTMTYYFPSSLQRTMRSGSGFGSEDSSAMEEWRF